MKDFNIKQSIRLLVENPFFTVISIIGTAIAITMVMVIIIMWQVRTASYEPEVHRDRMMILKTLMCREKGAADNNRSWCPTPAFMKEVVYPVEGLEHITAVGNGDFRMVSIPDRTQRVKAYYVETDTEFWKVFRFQFLDGKPFEMSTQTSQTRPAVICESVARKLFGKTEVSGQEITIGGKNYRVAGVVKDISALATSSYAEIWIPYANDELLIPSNEVDWLGDFRIIMLTKSSGDFSLIRQRMEESLKRFNSNLQEQEYDMLGQPDNMFTSENRVWSNVAPKMTEIYLQYGITLLILLLVPAVNLSGISSSRMQKRLAELGTRRAFGATRPVLMRQILMENMILTLIGSLLGLVFAYISILIMKDWLFVTFQTIDTAKDMFLTPSMLITPSVFLIALLFCLVLNLLSASIPAWNVTRKPIVEALNER